MLPPLIMIFKKDGLDAIKSKPRGHYLITKTLTVCSYTDCTQFMYTTFNSRQQLPWVDFPKNDITAKLIVYN